MLEECAPGYSKKSTNHSWQVSYNGYTYPTLPLGGHGKRHNPGIQVGHVKKMARFLGILECARDQLSQLSQLA